MKETTPMECQVLKKKSIKDAPRESIGPITAQMIEEGILKDDTMIACFESVPCDDVTNKQDNLDPNSP